MAHTDPKTQSQFNKYLAQKSSTVLQDDGERKMVRRGNSTQQWDWNGSRWVLVGFS